MAKGKAGSGGAGAPKRRRPATANASGTKPKKPATPFGKVVRRRALDEHLAHAGAITHTNAWEHVYRLLLSIDRRTGLAHIYDSNHMQRGGMFHRQAVAFTTALCEQWQIDPAALAPQIDVMFRYCVEEYLRQKAAGVDPETGSKQDADEEADVRSSFAAEIGDLLAQAGLAPDDVRRLTRVVEEKAEHYFTIERKRQNVRGEGFEDILELLLGTVSGVPEKQIKVRTRAPELPGFKPEVRTEGVPAEKVPKPDIALLSPDASVTMWILTAKWSLRQDRLDQFGQEYVYYAGNKIQSAQVDFMFVTNEMDIARLRAVLSPIEGSGGFRFKRVYHVNLDLLRAIHPDRFGPELQVYVHEGRLCSLGDLLQHARAQIVPR